MRTTARPNLHHNLHHWILLTLMGCGPTGEIDTDKASQSRQLCREVHGDPIECVSVTGVTATFDAGDVDSCVDDAIPKWAKCGLSTEDVVGCRDALSECKLEDRCPDEHAAWVDSESSEATSALGWCMFEPCQAVFDCEAGVSQP